MSNRPPLPARTSSQILDTAPHDAAKSDEEAIDDVYTQVEAMGSLEAAARKLAALAAVQQQQSGYTNRKVSSGSSRDDSGSTTGQQTGYDTGAQPQQVIAQAPKRPVWMDDPEEMEYQQGFVAVDQEGDDEGEGYEEMDQDQYGGEEDAVEIEHLQEVVPGLWIGDLVAAMDADGLRQRGITNIVSLLRPALEFAPDFATYHLEIDDSPTTDILTYLPSCVAWIQEALSHPPPSLPPRPLASSSTSTSPTSPTSTSSASSSLPVRSKDIDKRIGPTRPGSVLVHCQAGMSRSATVVAAYLMRAESLDPVDAVSKVKDARPVVDPSETFWHQLGLYYNADGKVTLRDRPTRQFYMERTTSYVMNEGGTPPMDKMAKFPATPSTSNPPTPVGSHGRRKIRCKMCRRHLAVREHMMDHILDQAPISRPRTPSNPFLPGPLPMSAIVSSPSPGDMDASSPGFGGRERERRASVVSDIINPLTGRPGAIRSRNASLSLTHPEAMTVYQRDSATDASSPPAETRPQSAGVPLPRGPNLLAHRPSLSLTHASPEPAGGSAQTLPNLAAISSNPAVLRNSNNGNGHANTFPQTGSGRPMLDADQLAAKLPPHLLALRAAGQGMTGLASPIGSSPPSSPETDTAPSGIARRSSLGTSSTQGAGARAAGRKMSMLALTPSEAGQGQEGGPQGQGWERRGSAASLGGMTPMSLPILANPKCSGYFVEPLTWMEPVLASGAVAGKLVCPNEKCGAKIGNFDWAGVQCGCKEWVTPGFCIHRSKVDEVW